MLERGTIRVLNTGLWHKKEEANGVSHWPRNRREFAQLPTLARAQVLAEADEPHAIVNGCVLGTGGRRQLLLALTFYLPRYFKVLLEEQKDVFTEPLGLKAS